MSDFPFEQISDSALNPQVAVEIGEPIAPGALARPTIIRGQRIANQGTGTSGVAYISFSADDVGRLFGYGSQIHRMAEIVYENDRSPDKVIVIADDDPNGGAKAAGSHTFAFSDGATLTESQTLKFLVAGLRLDVNLTAGMSITEVGDAIKAALGVDEAAAAAMGSRYRVTAANVAGVVTYTARNAGTCGNDLRVFLFYWGDTAGEALKGNLTVTDQEVELTGGTGTPDITVALSALTAAPHFAHIHPNYGADELAEMKTDTNTRWSPQRMTYGVHHTGIVKTAVSDYLGTGKLEHDLQNDWHGSVAVCPKHPNPSDELGAGYAARLLPTLRNDPALPCSYLKIEGLYRVRPADQIDSEVVEQLSRAGFSTCGYDAEGYATISLERSTYLRTTTGAPSKAGQAIQFTYTTAESVKFLRVQVQTRYPRCKLVPDGARVRSGQAAVSRLDVLADIAGDYAELEGRAWFRSAAEALAATQIEYDPNNGNRLNLQVKGGIVNQLRIFAMRFIPVIS